MIPRIEWTQSGFNLHSPFDRGKNERQIELTFDSKALKKVSGENSEALTILYELSHLAFISTLIFEGNEFPRISVGENEETSIYRKITILGTDGEPLSGHQGIYTRNIDDNSIISLMGTYSSHLHDELIKTREMVIPVEAHFALRRDIFITVSPFLLGKQQYFRNENIRTPLEALKIVGLFLRSRNVWIYQVNEHSRIHSTRENFYWTLARSRLSKISGFSFSISETIIRRCSRALQARDEIGKLFYSSETHDLIDQVLYHFDYLNILLMGALDALAVALNEKYHIVKSNSARGFTRDTFVKALKSAIPKLAEYIETEDIKVLIGIVSELRNTVHSERLSSRGELLIELPDVLRDRLWSYSQKHGENSDWGLAYEKYNSLDEKNKALIPKYRITLEPYTYAVHVTDLWLNLLNSIGEIAQQDRTNLTLNPSYGLSDAELEYRRRILLLG